MEPTVNSEIRYSGRTFAEINALHQRFWREKSEKMECQLRDEYLAKEAFIEVMDQRRLPFHSQTSYYALLDKAEAHRDRLLSWVRQENGRKGGKCPKADKLQELIEGIVAKRQGIDCPTLLELLSHKQGAGVIEDVDEDEIYFVTDNGREKSARITGLKDRLCRARKKVESQKAVPATQH